MKQKEKENLLRLAQAFADYWLLFEGEVDNKIYVYCPEHYKKLQNKRVRIQIQIEE